MSLNKRHKLKITIQDTKDAYLLAKINHTVQDIHLQKYPKYFKAYNFDSIKDTFQDLIEKEDWQAVIAIVDKNPVGYAIFYKRNFH